MRPLPTSLSSRRGTAEQNGRGWMEKRRIFNIYSILLK
jgi:hypothetical protein